MGPATPWCQDSVCECVCVCVCMCVSVYVCVCLHASLEEFGIKVRYFILHTIGV